MARIGWTTDPVTVANTNRDGTGTLYRVMSIQEPGGQYVDSIVCHSFGTNIATEAVLIGSNGAGLTNENNNFLIGSQALLATTLGTPLTTDSVIFQIGVWFDKGFEIHALVNDAQAAGRQFVCYASPTYEIY